MTSALRKRSPVSPPAKFFRSAADFRRWLERHHTGVPELLVGFHRKETGRGGLTYREALDEALCFGWIDGVRRSRGDGSYEQRFTPRRPRSYWSAINIRRMKELIAEGRVHPSGLSAFSRRDEDATGRYSFERDNATFTPAEKNSFRRNAAAWSHFSARPPGYRRVATFWVVSAKRADTRARRLQTLIDLSARGEPLPMFDRRKPAGTKRG